MTDYEKQYTPEQKELADKFIKMEKDALDKYYAGDMSGYLELWSKEDFSYFDIALVGRIDSYKEVEKKLEPLQGVMHADSYEFLIPRVQFSNDNSMGVLTYQLHADTNLIFMHYDVIEVFKKFKDGWHVVHSTWSFIQPMNFDWSEMKKAV